MYEDTILEQFAKRNSKENFHPAVESTLKECLAHLEFDSIKQNRESLDRKWQKAGLVGDDLNNRRHYRNIHEDKLIRRLANNLINEIAWDINYKVETNNPPHPITCLEVAIAGKRKNVNRLKDLSNHSEPRGCWAKHCNDKAP